MRLFIDSFFLQYNSIFNLCHFSMTPLRTITQHINDAPYTTPAERGLKIEARAYCRNVISGRGLFRLVLNAPIWIAERSICTYTTCSYYFEKYFILYNSFHIYVYRHISLFKSLSYSPEVHSYHVRRSYISHSLLSYVYCVVIPH